MLGRDAAGGVTTDHGVLAGIGSSGPQWTAHQDRRGDEDALEPSHGRQAFAQAFARRNGIGWSNRPEPVRAHHSGAADRGLTPRRA